jgi:hypothetical protein
MRFLQKLSISPSQKAQPLFAMHPNTEMFVKQLHDLHVRLTSDPDLKGLDMPEADDLSYKYNQTIQIDGIDYEVSVVIWLGVALGRVCIYACLDGKVVLQPLTTGKPAELWTKEHAVSIPHTTNKVFKRVKKLLDGLVTPMSRETKALVQYYINLEMIGNALSEHGLPFPETEATVAALKMFVTLIEDQPTKLN